ncbi:DUF4810 domain-containing protein [Luminiphilus sp.]|nr:DUF4810 domain-containing protein [Luminiphilus sp.]MDB2616185.1 DUF4810 domain-containing protein [Luminiphilus sp.]MDB3923439.1 DUF4810 domain-containing protein [Luminiphilus sp.]
MKNNIAVACLLVLLVTGCSSVSDAGYYWGNYAGTLYSYQKDPSPESLAQHEEELKGIVEYSNENTLKVPPGIFAELGFIEQRRGNEALSRGYYEQEMAVYPESRLFLERISSDVSSEGGE